MLRQSFTGFWISHSALHVPGLGIWQGCEYARVNNALIMLYFAWMCLNNVEYACMYLHKQSSEYAVILNVSDKVHKVTVHITEQLSRQWHIQNTVKHLTWRVLLKEYCLCAGVQPEMFLARGGFVELGHFDKHFLKNASQRHCVENFGVFSPRYSYKQILIWRI